MESKFFLLLSCFFLLFLLSPFLVLPHQLDRQTTPSAMDFLKTLNGTRKGDTAEGLSRLKKYLTHLGHMNPTSIQSPDQNHDVFFDDNLELGIKAYQTFFKLTVNGILDSETLVQLGRPRCGVPDKLRNHTHGNGSIPRIGASHYSFFEGEPKWPPNFRLLSYSFPPNTRGDANAAMLNAVQQWAAHSPFGFTNMLNYDQAEIKISFQVRDHGDGSPFDGPGGILAHAFAPTDGRLHFDGDENWVDGVVPGKMDLQTVGLHEMGHILGLMHSTDQNAVMWPYMDYGTRKNLNQDDIDGINALYK